MFNYIKILIKLLQINETRREGSVNKVYRFYFQHSFFRKWYYLQQVFLLHKEETNKQGGD